MQPGLAREGPPPDMRMDTGAAWTGWVGFAGILMVLLGGFNILDGLVALFKPEFYVAGEDSLLAFDFTSWGWGLILFGALVLFAGLAVMRGRVWGRTVGVILVSLNAIAHMAFISAFPIWTIMIVAIDVIVIYALIVHGAEMGEPDVVD